MFIDFLDLTIGFCIFGLYVVGFQSSLNLGMPYKIYLIFLIRSHLFVHKILDVDFSIFVLFNSSHSFIKSIKSSINQNIFIV